MKYLLLLALNIVLSINQINGQDIKIGNQTAKDYSKQQPTLNGANIYRSQTNQYRIKIPKNWELNSPNSIGVEFNAIHPLGVASFNIAVADYDKPPKITAHSFPVDKLFEQLKSTIPNAIFNNSKKLFLANEECLLLKYTFNYKTLDIDVNIVSSQYYVIKNKKSFVLTFQVQEPFESMLTTVFEETLISFFFEDKIYPKSD